MIISTLATILTLLGSMSLTIADDDTNPQPTISTSINFTGNSVFIYDLPNTYYYTSTGNKDIDRSNTYGHTYRFQSYIDLGDGLQNMHTIEFQTNNSSDANKKTFYLTITQNNALSFSESNFTCSIAFCLYNGNDRVFTAVSDLYQNSAYLLDSGNSFFTAMYDSNLGLGNGTIYNSQVNNDWYTLPYNFNKYCIFYFWQYQTPYANTDGSYYQGYLEGYDNGYIEGNNDGDLSGYTRGYNEALDTFNETNEVFVSSVSSILEVGLLPVNIFMTLLNIEVFGINVGAFITSLLTIVVIVILMRTLFGGKGGKDN